MASPSLITPVRHRKAELSALGESQLNWKSVGVIKAEFMAQLLYWSLFAWTFLISPKCYALSPIWCWLTCCFSKMLMNWICKSQITASIVLTHLSTKHQGRQPVLLHATMKTRQQHTACLILSDNPHPSNITVGSLMLGGC